MKLAKELITQPRHESSAPASNGLPIKVFTKTTIQDRDSESEQLTPRHFDRLWLRMTEAFGHKWTSSFGERPTKTWTDGLNDMTVADLKRGLVSLKMWQEDSGWPPTLLQFRELCRPHSAPAHSAYVPLPEPLTPFELRQQKAAQVFQSLRDGILKPAIEERNIRLSDEDRVLMETLDWERIRNASLMGMLGVDEI